jgi:hypothetical protein
MLRLQFECLLPGLPFVPRVPKVFPFLPVGCLSQNEHGLRQFETVITLCFSISYGRYFCPSGLRAAPRLDPPASAPVLGANHAPKALPLTRQIVFLLQNLAEPPSASFLFITKNFHWQQSRSGSRRQRRGAQRDSHRHEGDPHTVPYAGMKWHIRNGIYLWIQGNKMKRPG